MGRWLLFIHKMISINTKYWYILMSAVGLVVGARGWEYDAWAEQYYPNDLPMDWRLAYYANEFLVTLVPANIWSIAPADNVANWVEDTSDKFRFLFELPTSTQALSALL